MITLEGIAKQPGFAIAVAAVVDAKNGINGVSPALLQSGISALKKGLAPIDYPEAIIVCDNLAMGAVTKIPGISTIGLAAESSTDTTAIPIDVPCVIGVYDLIQSVSEGDIVVVDGSKGVVHIAPDPLTLTHYQQAEELRHIRERVFVSSEHIPARMQTGETVFVHAHIRDEAGLHSALENGADGLIVDLRGNYSETSAFCQEILRDAAGKPVTFALEVGCEDILRASMYYCTPGQVVLVSENPDFLASQVDTAMDMIVLEALQLDVEPPQVRLGWIARAGICDLTNMAPLVIDALEAEDVAGILAGQLIPEEIVTLIGSRVDALEPLVRAGARHIGIEPELIENAKYAIRFIGLEDES